MQKNQHLSIVLSVFLTVPGLVTPALAQQKANTPATQAPKRSADAAYNDGVTRYQTGDIAGAMAAFQEAIRIRPSFTDAHFNLGICYTHPTVQNPNEALTEFSWVIDRKPTAPKGTLTDALLERGRVYITQKQADKAVADFQKALEIKPDKYEVLPALAGAYFAQGNTDSAITTLDNYLVKAGNDALPTAYRDLGVIYLTRYRKSASETDARNALTAFGKFIAANKESAEGYLLRGDALAAAKAYDKAVADYTAYLARNPKDAYAYSARGRAYMELKRFPEAVKDYTAATEIDPRPEYRVNLVLAKSQTGDKTAFTEAEALVANLSPELAKPVLATLAQGYLNDKQYERAVTAYTRLLAQSKDTTALYNRGVAYSLSGQNEKAIADFKACIADPNAPDKALAYNALGAAYLNAKQYADAVAAYDSYIAQKPEDVTALYNRGVAYYNLGVTATDPARSADYNLGVTATDPARSAEANRKAAADLQAYLAKKPTDKALVAQAYKLLSGMPSQSGPEQEKLLTEAIVAAPQDGDLLVNRGVFYLNQKPPQYDKAVADFTEAARIARNDPAVRYNLAVAYAGKKDWKSVIKYTTEALKLKSDYADALVVRADANFNEKAYAAAVADYKQYATLADEDKNKAYAFNQMANAAARAEDYSTTIDALTGYLKVAPTEKQSEGLIRRGIAYLAANKNTEGIQDLTAALEAASLPEEKALALFNRGLAYSRTEDSEKAARDFEQSFVAKPDFAAAYQAALMYTRQADKLRDNEPMQAAPVYEKAVTFYDKAIAVKGATLDREVADACYNKAVTLESKFRADEQLESLKAAVAAYSRYLEIGRGLTPPATDLTEVEAHIEQLKKQIADLS